MRFQVEEKDISGDGAPEKWEKICLAGARTGWGTLWSMWEHWFGPAGVEFRSYGGDRMDEGLIYALGEESLTLNTLR